MDYLVFQERKAEKSLDALKEMAAPQVNVLRDGQWMKIPSREVVVGDILKFSSGDRIGADLRIIDHSSLEIEESALTGESLPAVKCSDPLMNEVEGIGDQENMAFMGTMVTRGNGVGIVIATGMNTAMGKIADLLQTAENKRNTASTEVGAARQNFDRHGLNINCNRSPDWCHSRT